MSIGELNNDQLLQKKLIFYIYDFVNNCDLRLKLFSILF